MGGARVWRSSNLIGPICLQAICLLLGKAKRRSGGLPAVLHKDCTRCTKVFLQAAKQLYICLPETMSSNANVDQTNDVRARPRRRLPQRPSVGSRRPLSAPSGRLRRVSHESGVGGAIDASHTSQASVQEAGSRLSVSPPGTRRRDFVSPVKFIQPGEGEDSSVTVAVRVRPFSER